MMAALRTPSMLPQVRGTYAENAPLKDFVWFRAGGPAEILYRPADLDDLCAFMAAKPQGLPVGMIGVGSNLLIRDGGIPGVVIRLPGAFGKIEALPGARIRAGAAALDSAVARASAEAGIGGLEFLRTIPGTIGGALRMNAGCYGAEIKDVLIEARAVDGHGKLVTLSAAEMGFSYRHSNAPEDLVFVDAVLQGKPEAPEAVQDRMNALMAERERSQPSQAKTGGSTFKNPPTARAWELIDRAGCRGLKKGGAQISEKHANFLINTGDATAADLEALGEEVRARVRAATGVELEWEIKRVGKAKEGGS
jgi:UDP-N-acetylmuramate dehydrogenase